MTEIYWITRLASIRVLAVIILVLAIIALVVVFICYLELMFDDDVESVKAFAKKWRTTWICSMLFGIAGVVFIPSERDMLLIYGLGSTIDYVKSNDKAKQLPDKAVDALTRYLDSIQSKKNKE